MNDKIVRAYACGLYFGNAHKLVEVLKVAEQCRKRSGLLRDVVPHFGEFTGKVLDGILDMSCVAIYLSRDAFLRAYGVDTHGSAREEMSALGSAVSFVDELLVAAGEHGLALLNAPDDDCHGGAGSEIERARAEGREKVVSLYARLGEETTKSGEGSSHGVTG